MTAEVPFRSEINPPATGYLTPDVDHIYFWDIAFLIGRGWRIILASIIGMVILASIATFFSHPAYRAVVVVADAGTDVDASRASSPLRQISSILGSNTTTGAAPSMFENFTFLITSLTLGQRMEQKHHILSELYAAEWNAETGTWERKGGGLVASIRPWLQELFGFPAWAPPSAADLAAFLKNRLILSHPGPGFDEIALALPDRQLALKIVTYVVEDTESLLRETQIEETARQISYLESQLKGVTVQEHRTVLTNLLLSQEQKMMLMRSGAPVAVRVLEGPAVSDLPVSPNVFLNLVIGIAGGVVLGVILVFVINAWKYRRTA